MLSIIRYCSVLLYVIPDDPVKEFPPWVYVFCPVWRSCNSWSIAWAPNNLVGVYESERVRVHPFSGNVSDHVQASQRSWFRNLNNSPAMTKISSNIF